MEQQPNNEQIIERLLGEQKAPNAKETMIAGTDDQILITTSRVVGIRYRVYFLVCLVLAVIFGNYILLPARDVFQTTR